MILAVLFLSACEGSYSSPSSSSTSSGDGKSNKIEAFTCAQMEVQDMLVSPSTAEFEYVSSSEATTALGGEKYLVSSYVDAQNSFGATVREYFTCSVTYYPNDGSCLPSCSFQ